ncbi:hypothetical protein B5X24_HaOG212017 [Helicoverpa armigera]|nr:hypothetical protein B5X24_HaOG212017 [Helicoverpa armigera]
MLAVTLLTTVAYEFIWVIADSSTCHKSEDNGCMWPLSKRDAKMKLKIRSIFAQVVMAHDYFNNVLLTWN